MIYPYNPNVWIGVFITFGVVTLSLLVISKIEGSILNVQFVDWLTIPSSLWYVYGTFVGESNHGLIPGTEIEDCLQVCMAKDGEWIVMRWSQAFLLEIKLL